MRQGRTAEAIGLCLAAEKTDSSTRPALNLAMLLTIGQAGEEHGKQVEPVFESAVERHPRDAELRFALANLRVVQGRGPDAVRLYQEVLERQPNHVAALQVFDGNPLFFALAR